MTLDLDNVRMPTWDFSVKVDGKVYTTHFPKTEELNAFSGIEAKWEELCPALGKFINEPDANLLQWGPHKVIAFAAGYLEYTRRFIELHKAAAAVPSAAEIVAQQMAN